MPSYAFLWRTSDFSMEVGETVTITLSYKNIDQSIPIFEDGVQIGTTTTNTYDYTPTSNGTHTLHYFNTIECSPLTVTVTGGGIVSGNDTTTLNGALTELGETIADNLTSMGVTASANDGLTTLANKVLQISGSGGSGSGQEIVSFNNITTEFNYTKKRGNYGFSVNIPNGVTTLGDSCFSGCTGLTSVDIPSNVTSLGQSCFYNCTGLTSVTIPSSVTSLGVNCFSACTGLTSVTIPNGVTSLGNSCFYNCTGLTSVTIPSSVTNLGVNCFSGCTGLTSVTIQNGVTSLGIGCFYNCTGLTSVTIPSSVTSLGNSCFYGCTGLTSVTIPSSVISLGVNCFSACTGLTSVTIQNGVTSLGNSCFSACTGLTSVTIPSSVTSLGSSCFSKCTGLTSITIPSSVTTLQSNCFRYCTNLVDYQLYWETPPVNWSANLMPNNTDTYFTIPSGTTANYTAKSFPSEKLVERSE